MAFAHTVPYDVGPTVLSDSELSPANGAHSHSSVRSAVDLDRFGEAVVSWLAADVEDVLGVGRTFEVDEVDNTFGVNGALWLNAIVRCAQQTNLGCGFVSAGNRGKKERERE